MLISNYSQQIALIKNYVTSFLPVQVSGSYAHHFFVVINKILLDGITSFLRNGTNVVHEIMMNIKV